MSSPSYYRVESFDSSSSAFDLDRFIDERDDLQEVNVGLAMKADEPTKHHCWCGAPGGSSRCVDKGCQVICGKCGNHRSARSQCIHCDNRQSRDNRGEAKAEKKEANANKKRKAGSDDEDGAGSSRRARKPKHTAHQKEHNQKIAAAAHDVHQAKANQGGIVKMAKARTVPRMYGSTGKPCSSHFIKKFDRFIRSIDPNAVFAPDWMETDGAYDEDVEMADGDVMEDDDEDDGMCDGHLWKNDNQFMKDAAAGRRLRHIDNFIGMVVRRRCRY